MSVAVPDLPPTPTSQTVIRPEGAPRASENAPTRAEQVEPVMSPPEPELAESKRFTILRPFARGGQGHVYIARDEQLGREVALKELKPRHAERSASRGRFIREAEIAGGLEHPGVVPVYALGKHADGRPYYAMRFIQGRTLHDVIAEYHKLPSTTPADERNVRFRQLLQRFVSVCQTIAFAHSRGIIHRDVKPSNILIGSYGEAVVVDWGLARPYHPLTGCSEEPELAPSGDTPRPVVKADSTLMGSALGTPAFMSPEQADGQWDRVGPATDIYSLGATLYVVLTGMPPLPQQAWTEMARKIRVGEIKPPRQVKPAVPRPLEAICLKAIALDAARRYETALELAADVEHWLADERVRAWREPALERARRWVRRHRTLVSSAAALWITAGLAVSVGLVVVERERGRTEIAYQRTRKTLDRMTSKFIDEWLSRQPKLLPVHQDFLREAVAEYEEFAKDTGHDVRSRFGAVQAHRRVGEIRLRLGQSDEAAAALTKAAGRLAELAAEFPAEPEIPRERARILTAQGKVSRIAGDNERAESLFAHAKTIREESARTKPGDRQALRELATGYSNYAAASADLKRSGAADAFNEALKLRKTVAEMKSASADEATEAEQELAAAFNNLGRYLANRAFELSKPPNYNPRDNPDAARLADEAERAYRSAAEIGERLVQQAEGVSGNHEELATASLKLGSLLLKQRRSADAGPWLTRAADQYERLSKLHPTVPEFRRELAGIRYLLGQLELSTRPAEALGQFDGALTTLAELQKRGQQAAQLRNTALAAHVGRAQALEKLGRHADSAAAWGKAVELHPDGEARQSFRTYRAYQRLKAGQLDAALAEVTELATNTSLGGEPLYNSACVLGQAAAMQPQRRDEYASRAVALLRRAQEVGYFQNPERRKKFDTDADFDPLRGADGFKRFRSDLPPAPVTTPR